MYFSKRFVSGVLAASILVGSPLLADNLSSALKKFNARAESLQALESGFREYVGILSTDQNVEHKKFAALQMGRLALFSNMLTKVSAESVSDDKKRELLEECVSKVELIADTKSSVYHYVKIACTSLRTKLSKNMFDRLGWATSVQKAQAGALESTTTGGAKVAGFEVGGVLRVLSAVRSNSGAQILSGMYNPQEGYEFSKIALNATNQFVKPFGEIDGRGLYDNCYYFSTAAAHYATTSKDKKYLTEALEVAEKALQDYEERVSDETLPEGREPESKYYKLKLEEVKSIITSCESQDNWKSCVQKGLDEL